jgi:membrane peptidoglycan carboxypeptidase
MRPILILKKTLVALGWPPLFIIKLIWIAFKIIVRAVRSYIFLGSMLLGMSGVLIWLYLKVIVGLPNVNEIYNPPRLSSKILDRNGELLYKFYEDEDRTWVPLTKIPKSLILATLAIEDKSFLQHQGISIKGVAQAVIYNVLKRSENGSLQGGSTITQQLVKSVFFSNERTWRRKTREAILALLVERKLTKEEILERYFNQVAYGGETYGVQEASKNILGKMCGK